METLDAALRFASSSHRLLINGQWVDGSGNRRIQVENPGDETFLASVPCAAHADVDSAVSAAQQAFLDGRWSNLSPSEKTLILLKLADLIDKHSEFLATLETLDNGKPIQEARADVGGSIDVLRYYAGWPSKIYGETIPTETRFTAFSVREPVGVCGLIVPWNFPLLMAMWKIAPALACGNTFVLKPAEQTPLSTLFLGKLCLDAGIPPGVVNIITGDGTTGKIMVEHSGIDKIAFTGSTEVGKKIMSIASETMKRVHLELGGKNANIIFADSDLDAAIPAAYEGAFENAGQACTAGSRLIVERSIYDRVIADISRMANAAKVGPGIEEDTQIGAIVSRAQLNRIQSYFRIAEEEGAVIAAGGREAGYEKGYFLRPTVISEVTPDMRVAKEEIFGPVVTVTPFDSPEEAVRIANGTPYGLGGAIWHRDIKKAHLMSRALRFGTVWLNAYGKVRSGISFGGYKQSGFGRDLGKYAIDEYTEIKSVFVDLS